MIDDKTCKHIFKLSVGVIKQNLNISVTAILTPFASCKSSCSVMEFGHNFRAVCLETVINSDVFENNSSLLSHNPDFVHVFKNYI